MNATKRPGPANSGTFLALLALLLVAAGLLGLTAMVLPTAFGILAVLFGFFSFGALHYLLWGWWLKPKVRDEPDEGSAE